MAVINREITTSAPAPLSNIPDFVKYTEMRRHWWVAYDWIYVCEAGDGEERYIRGLPRPIDEAITAGNQFDEMQKNRGACQCHRFTVE